MKLPLIFYMLLEACMIGGNAYSFRKTKITTDDTDSNPVPTVIPKIEPPKEEAVLIIQNKKEYESLQNHKDLDYEETCKLKQGYVIEVLTVEEKEGRGEIITGRPVFAVLNKKTLAFFENENVNALLKSVDIKYLKSPLVPKNWGGLFCFQLIKDSVIEKIKKSDSSKKNKRPSETVSSICLSDLKHMDSWMNAISDFHNCVVKEIYIEEESIQEPVYQKKIRVRLEEEKEKELERVNEDTEREDENEKKTKDEDLKEEKVIEEEVKEMQREYLRQKAHERRVKRKLEEERKRMEAKTKKLEDEQKCLERALEAKAIAEEKQAETMIKYEEEKKLQKEMKTATKSVIEETKKEESLIEKHEKELIENQKKIQKEISGILVQEVVQSEKFLDPKVCFSDEVSNSSYVGKICTSIDAEYGKPLNLQKVDTCTRNFCQYCCDYHIGGDFASQRLTCTTKCRQSMEPKPIIRDDEYVTHASSKNKIE